MANEVVFESREIKMGAADFLKEFMFRFVWIWILGLSVAGVAGLVLGITVDIRWLIVGLGVALIVCPMVFAFLYYYYGLRRECFVNTFTHRLLIGEDGITARLILKAADESETEEEIRDEFFPYSSMTRFRIGSKSAIIPFRKPAKGFIWIPADAFVDEEELAAALKYIDIRTDEDSQRFK